MVDVVRTTGALSGYGGTASAPAGSFSGPGLVVLTGTYFYVTGSAASSGFSQVAHATDARSSDTTSTFVLIKQSADLGSEPASYAITTSGGDHLVRCHFLQNVDGTTPVLGSTSAADPAGPSTVTLPNINVLVSGSLALIVAGSWTGGQWQGSQSPPSGYALAAPDPPNGEYSDFVAASLPTGNIGGSFTIGVDRYAVIQIVFQPAAGPPPSVTPLVETQPGYRPLPARRALEQWSPLSALPAAVLTRLGFAQELTPRRARRAQVEAWEPLPALPAPQARPAVFQPATTTKRAPAAPASSWSVLAPLLRPFVDCPDPLPRRAARARADGWEPLAALATPPAPVVSVDATPPLQPRRRAPVVDGWTPLPSLTAPSLVRGGWDSQPVTRRQQRAEQQQNWTPLE
jgi:hypothetical protein